MKNSVTIKGESTRKKIFEASIKLFKTNGYKNTSIKLICKESNIGVGTFYHHFSSKKDIITAFVDHEQDTIFNTFKSLDNTSCYNNLLSILKLQYDFLELKDKEFLSYFLSFNILEPSDDNLFLTSPIQKLILKNLQTGEDLGQFNCFKNPNYTTDMIVNLFLGHATMWSSTKSSKIDPTLKKLYEEMVDLIDLLLAR